MRKPVIGISTRSFKDHGNSLLGMGEEYRLAIIKAGGIPLFIAPINLLDYGKHPTKEESKFTEEEIKNYHQILSLCDGFLIPGGEEIYDFDRLVCQYAYENDLPYLGICLGMQILGNIDSFFKGEVTDDTVLNQTEINHYQPEVLFVHKNRIFPSKLFDILGVSEISVNSRHHYHIEEKDIFKVSSRSSDGLIEGIEIPNKKFMIGVQWHPESMISSCPVMLRLFKALIKSCNE